MFFQKRFLAADKTPSGKTVKPPHKKHPPYLAIAIAAAVAEKAIRTAAYSTVANLFLDFLSKMQRLWRTAPEK